MKKNDVNIVNRVCKILEISQKELAELLDVSAATVSTWNKGDIPKMAHMALQLMLENRECKNKLKKIKEAQDIISSLSV